jgi:hypothetical protein
VINSDIQSRDGGSEGTSDDTSITSQERKSISKKKKDLKKSFKSAFVLDRKNKNLVDYFNDISHERINK